MRYRRSSPVRRPVAISVVFLMMRRSNDRPYRRPYEAAPESQQAGSRNSVVDRRVDSQKSQTGRVVRAVKVLRPPRGSGEWLHQLLLCVDWGSSRYRQSHCQHDSPDAQALVFDVALDPVVESVGDCSTISSVWAFQ